MSKGYVYVMSNPCMPGVLKIGKTTREPESRAGELYQTGVPAPFKVEHSAFSPDCSELERTVHSALADRRVNVAREFFCVTVDDAVRTLDSAHREITEVWLDEFIPFHSPAMADMVPDEGAVLQLADEMFSHPFEVVAAMSLITADELEPALNRLKSIIAGRLKALPAQEAVH